MNNQIFYNAVVEDIMDPLFIGRVRVRVIGLHTENKKLLPTEDLPWATPIMPITSASVSGVGRSPTGLVCGSWVVVYFSDPESKQQPMIMGSIVGIPTEESNTFENSEESTPIDFSKSFATGDSFVPQELLPLELTDRVKSEKFGQILDYIRSLTEVPEEVAEQEIETLKKQEQQQIINPVSWTLGQTSKKYESGNLGPGAINDYVGSASWDMGGASYGAYQFASYLPIQVPETAIRNAGRLREKRRPSPLEEYINSSKFKDLFKGLTPATTQFDEQWKIVANYYQKEFLDDQHNHVKKKYYDPVISKLRSIGIDVSNRGPAVHDAIWSTSVQYWHGKTVNLIKDAIGNKTQISDEDFIVDMYNLKFNRFPNESDRISREMRDLISLCHSGATTDGLNTFESPGISPTAVLPINDSVKAIVESPQSAEFDFQAENLNKILNSEVLGFSDPTGKFPKAEYYYRSEPDSSRLSRAHRLDQTVVAKKKRTMLSGAAIANGGGTWGQPEIPYGARYPHNHVTETESGHLFEMDDTEGSERIHVYHKAGTFVEIDNNGTMVRKIVGDNYEIIERNGNIYIGGQCNVTVNGSINIYAYGETNVESEGDVNVVAHNNVDVQASGKIDLYSAETLTLKANKIILDSDTNIDMTAKKDVNIKAEENVGIVAKEDYVVKGSGLGSMRFERAETYVVEDFSITAGNMFTDVIGKISYQNGESTASDTNDVNGNFIDILPELATNGVPTTGRKSVDVIKLEPLQPAARIDVGAFYFETEEERMSDSRSESTDFVDYKLAIAASKDSTIEDFKSRGIQTKSYQPKNVVRKELVPSNESEIKSMENYPDNLKLSPNFTLGKVSSNAVVTKNRVKDQFGITSADAVANLQNICLNVLEPIIQKYPNMIVTSGFRHKNTGSKMSDHVLGQAVDLQFKGVQKSEYFEIAKEISKLVPFKQLLLEYKSTGTGLPWIHVSLSRNNAENLNKVSTFFNHKKHADGLHALA